jgi:hypothetical protein
VKKPKIEIQEGASDFLERDAVKRMSKKRAAQRRTATQSDLPPWKRDSMAARDSIEQPETKDKEQSSLIPLWSNFNRLFSKDDAYALLATGGAGGFGAAAILMISAGFLAGDQLNVISLGLIPLVFVVWTLLVVVICTVRHKKQVRRVAFAMASEMVRLESELRSIDLIEVPSNQRADPGREPEKVNALANSDSEWH